MRVLAHEVRGYEGGALMVDSGVEVCPGWVRGLERGVAVWRLLPLVYGLDKIKIKSTNLRDRSCRLLCSLRLKARLQYWHLYFFSGAAAAFRGVDVEDEASVVVAMISHRSAKQLTPAVALVQSIKEVLLPRAKPIAQRLRWIEEVVVVVFMP
jgi:hypothetical protein